MSQDFWVRESGAEVLVEWKINWFWYFDEEPGIFYLHSPSFSFSDAQWFLEIRTNGWRSTDSSFLYLSLCKRFSTSKIHFVKYKLSILSTNGLFYESIDQEGEFEKHGVQEGIPFVPASELRLSKYVFCADRGLMVNATLELAGPTFLEDEIPLQVMHSKEVSFEWKVESFTSLPKKLGFHLKSPTFSFAHAEWCLKVYPNGRDSDDKGWVPLYLSREHCSSKKQIIAYTLGVRRRNGTPYRVVHDEQEFNTNDKYGCLRLIKLLELLDLGNELVHQGSVAFFCTLRLNTLPTTTVTEQDTQTSSDPSHYERAFQITPYENDEHSRSTCMILREDYRTIFRKESLCYVTIWVWDQKFWAILAARSSVFSAMLEQDSEERRTGIVYVNGFDPEAFLSFLYSGDVDAVTVDNAIPLYEAAYKYNL